MHAQVHHVGLAGAETPFAAVMPVAPVTGPDLGDAPRDWRRAPNVWLILTTETSAPRRAVNTPGIAHLCVQTRDGDTARPALEAAGVAFLSLPVALGTGFLYAYGFDADGRLIEMENAPFLRDEPPGWVGHVALVTDDIERLAGFYGGLLDVEPERGAFRNNPLLDAVAGLDGVDLEAAWVKGTGLTVEIWRYRAPAVVPPEGVASGRYTHIGVETDALDAAIAQLIRLGGNAGAVTAGLDGRSAWCADPDGNPLLLVEFRTSGWGLDALPHRDATAHIADARRDWFARRG